MSTAERTRNFLMKQSSDGGIDLFRRSPIGFVLVDTFDTKADAQKDIAILSATPLTLGVRGRYHEAA